METYAIVPKLIEPIEVVQNKAYGTYCVWFITTFLNSQTAQMIIFGIIKVIMVTDDEKSSDL